MEDITDRMLELIDEKLKIVDNRLTENINFFDWREYYYLNSLKQIKYFNSENCKDISDSLSILSSEDIFKIYGIFTCEYVRRLEGKIIKDYTGEIKIIENFIPADINNLRLGGFSLTGLGENSGIYLLEYIFPSEDGDDGFYLPSEPLLPSLSKSIGILASYKS